MSLHIFDVFSTDGQVVSTIDATLGTLRFGITGGASDKQSIIDALFKDAQDVTIKFGPGRKVASILIHPRKSGYEAGSLIVMPVKSE